MNNEKLSPGSLQKLLIEVLDTSDGFHLVSGVMPFEMSWRNVHYHVYVKNISSAYFKDRPDTTRAQLATKDAFSPIMNSPYPFIFLGYDTDNDVLVCWDYHVAKSRLNERKSISFYSRASFQKEVKSGEFLRIRLKNNDYPVLFKRTDLPKFFDQICTFFPDIEVHISEVPRKITSISDQRLLNKLRPLLDNETPHTLEAIKVAQRFYGHTPSMTFMDWLKLIKTVLT